ncbi:MAG: hypothetical protein ABIB97_01765 [Patescibacteria group bacterium]
MRTIEHPEIAVELITLIHQSGEQPLLDLTLHTGEVIKGVRILPGMSYCQPQQLVRILVVDTEGQEHHLYWFRGIEPGCYQDLKAIVQLTVHDDDQESP